jgi:hypothetical protein
MARKTKELAEALNPPTEGNENSAIGGKKCI